ncbi:unnamed protein product [Peronospora destructor]|uniref:Elicitin n=1 Tax=Peronospora destructor TaxID=86335 RepID=A0AAV0TTQ4_9STRA|nr:unnamed protein product [Peronospora destructor]
MQSCTFSLIAVAGAVASVYAADSCNMGIIQSTLLLNGTTWHNNCGEATGMDVFAMRTLPTEAEAQNIFQSRDCVNYLNQLNQQANTQIQCEMQVGDQTVVLATLLTDLLTGKSSNKTEVSFGSMSGSASAFVNNSASGSESGLVSSGSENLSSASADMQDSSIAEPDSSIIEPGSSIAEPDSSASISVTFSFAVVATAATSVLTFAL